ncbi:hypothetical protein ATK17_0903 [Branchiibius hedensis]|uniref:Uncharacterized protein n=1 Tax=Branchiibius hedensis TaxID=672460 RepID=A0A2Y8ZQN1_9MICO|nr:hypothetical protein [Branchiibius hedensis]PWJ24802.1 hypothetical protein ATK17_0903 [Branchiibius hedensis]SSA33618.1 hypothetical protein SAMN04489750_0903 [Branchiibius hedensis]
MLLELGVRVGTAAEGRVDDGRGLEVGLGAGLDVAVGLGVGVVVGCELPPELTTGGLMPGWAPAPKLNPTAVPGAGT